MSYVHNADNVKLPIINRKTKRGGLIVQKAEDKSIFSVYTYDLNNFSGIDRRIKAIKNCFLLQKLDKNDNFFTRVSKAFHNILASSVNPLAFVENFRNILRISL